MPHLKSLLPMLACMLGLGFATPSHAQWAVVDVGAITQLIQEVTTLKDQLDTARSHLAQAQQQYQSMTGGRGLEGLLSGTVRNYLPPASQGLLATLNGLSGSYGALAAQLKSTLTANAILTPDPIARFSDQERTQPHGTPNAA